MQKIPIASLMMACLGAGCRSEIEKPTQTSTAGAETSKVPLQLQQTAECMLKVLKTVLGVSEPRLDNATSGGWTPVSGVPCCGGIAVGTADAI